MSTSPSTPADLAAAASALRTAQDVVDSAIARLTEAGIDDNQVLAYDTYNHHLKKRTTTTT